MPRLRLRRQTTVGKRHSLLFEFKTVQRRERDELASLTARGREGRGGGDETNLVVIEIYRLERSFRTGRFPGYLTTSRRVHHPGQKRQEERKPRRRRVGSSLAGKAQSGGGLVHFQDGNSTLGIISGTLASSRPSQSQWKQFELFLSYAFHAEE